MFKYLGSKRVLVPVLEKLAKGSEAKTAVDLFTGTTRVAQAFKKQGIHTTAADIASYSHVLAQTYIATDAKQIDGDELQQVIERLNALPGYDGYITRTYCENARFFQPHNGRRIDAIRDTIEADYAHSPLRPLLLTSLLEAADRVDSTTGVQMAYLKKWAPRSYRNMELRVPELIPGPGKAIHADATKLVRELPATDLLYLDPPYNQHRYYTNYHIWETLVRWDAPQTYGVAQKRLDAREEHTKSIFNSKPRMKAAFFQLLQDANAQIVVVSYNNEAWITAEEMTRELYENGHEDVRLLEFDHARYVGARIGIYNPEGKKTGKISHTRNKEWIFVAGPKDRVEAASAAVEGE
ncbi:MAG: DNA adenine methylase [Actinomycetaceae bacterium]|nr:DNA adenine methylase [Actinomycetaceae bacterium]